MNEELILEAIQSLNNSVSELTKKKDDTLFKGIIGTLIAAMIIGAFVSWRTSEATTINVKNDIHKIKLNDNYNNAIISKTLNIPLMQHDISKDE